jgi:hypothetical protein
MVVPPSRLQQIRLELKESRARCDAMSADCNRLLLGTRESTEHSLDLMALADNLLARE